MRIALVTPWFGRELIGGAERHAWELAHALAGTGSTVDVLSTCCRSFNDDWASNYHRAGESRLGERLTLHRFRVDSRDRVAFNRSSAALTSLPLISLHGDRIPLDEREVRAFVSESINSRALQLYLRERATDYDAVLFMPYLYGTTLIGLPQIADKAFLIPCLHDEAYAYLSPVRECFAAARGILFNSLGEQETAASIYGPGILGKSRVVSEAVEPIPPPRAPTRLGTFTPHRSRYVLYLGRQVATKNIDFLVNAYKLFRERRTATSLQLVLAGPTSISRSGDGIVDLGPVSEEAKAGLITYARAVAQPSLHESFSRAVYESWYARRPVFVHGKCRATARAVEDSGGGWIGSTIGDWAKMFAELDESSDEAIDAVGERGWAAGLDNGSWEVVARRVLSAIESRLPRAMTIAVDQAVPLGEGSAVAYAAALDRALSEAGCDSTTVVAESASFRRGSLIVAHVAGTGVPILADAYIAHDGEPDFSPRHGPVFATTHAVAARLEERGIPARVLPLPVSPGRWDGVRPTHRYWEDGLPGLLSVSPLCGEDVRRLFDVFVAFLSVTGHARLFVFESDCDVDARAILLRERDELDLTNEVVLVDDDRSHRYAAYRSSAVALAIGRPLGVEAVVNALWFDIPIVSLGDPIAVDTLDAAGLVEDRFEPHRFAALLRIVCKDERLRSTMLIEARRVRERHAPGTIAGILLEQITALDYESRTRVDAQS